MDHEVGYARVDSRWNPRRVTAGDVVAGAVAGAAATWIMNQATTWMYNVEPQTAREREDAARHGETAYVAAARRIAGVAGVALDKDQASRAGTALHWTIGIGAGIGYAVARRRWPAIGRGAGLPFGLAFFALFDEGINTALGFTPPPRAFPWQTHARGAAGHALFGVATDLISTSVNPRSHLRRVEALLSTM